MTVYSADIRINADAESDCKRQMPSSLWQLSSSSNTSELRGGAFAKFARKTQHASGTSYSSTFVVQIKVHQIFTTRKLDQAVEKKVESCRVTLQIDVLLSWVWCDTF